MRRHGLFWLAVPLAFALLAARWAWCRFSPCGCNSPVMSVFHRDAVAPGATVPIILEVEFPPRTGEFRVKAGRGAIHPSGGADLIRLYTAPAKAGPDRITASCICGGRMLAQKEVGLEVTPLREPSSGNRPATSF